MSRNRNLFDLPPVYIQYEDCNWIEGGNTVGFRVMKNGEPTTSELQFFPGDAKQVIELLEAAGVPTRELVRGAPEKPRFKR
ncbi:hypothetical protein [Rhizobium herbae]|uniref:Uncharacterized protein n=1 Tax=Rhizobium herbae TaxID=508661 RepID=A0ABS4EFX5_9HYPH|nr:hypothetical protein [Rhizobium herbae]MBP1856847.1 hypothetical protein [Rhizobium herbae]